MKEVNVEVLQIVCEYRYLTYNLRYYRLPSLIWVIKAWQWKQSYLTLWILAIFDYFSSIAVFMVQGHFSSMECDLAKVSGQSIEPVQALFAKGNKKPFNSQIIFWLLFTSVSFWPRVVAHLRESPRFHTSNNIVIIRHMSYSEFLLMASLAQQLNILESQITLRLRHIRVYLLNFV